MFSHFASRYTSYPSAEAQCHLVKNNNPERSGLNVGRRKTGGYTFRAVGTVPCSVPTARKTARNQIFYSREFGTPTAHLKFLN